ncbi:5-formyltetrahydrofolate cyclo-ligase [Hymenobacter sp. BT770]|uniref:5-formyltetrahydrofolate cyclo-ligase n=1 Tax=Hymenobacter sp. BT770 TaxID=2886942 RepID=UPI001D125FAD|nr:5-formyltetrahydrofolate cyclo-ligase [Hymenobacter sp. BT770]MCC3151881.1 5-formyltetrahydrofolate cyclo-ligase [Hymenobacter sp. BT770]MDO3413497.1 5-formyltetrahydrofolate cyclo-ligase [Hymenobacter sp. BT770]
MNPDHRKAALRRAALVRRAALPAPEVARFSQRLCEQFFQHFPVAHWRWLHVFLPLARHNEPDTWLIIQRIWAEKLGVRLAVPVVQSDGISLKHYELTPNTPLQDNRWGIPEPLAAAATEVSPAAFDAVLVPLLAVDEAGHRVGYGGGFYDRFLAQCGPNTSFIGVSVLDDAPVARIADVLPTDIPLHAYLTPGGVWRF